MVEVPVTRYLSPAAVSRDKAGFGLSMSDEAMTNDGR